MIVRAAIYTTPQALHHHQPPHHALSHQDQGVSHHAQPHQLQLHLNVSPVVIPMSVINFAYTSSEPLRLIVFFVLLKLIITFSKVTVAHNHQAAHQYHATHQFHPFTHCALPSAVRSTLPQSHQPHTDHAVLQYKLFVASAVHHAHHVHALNHAVQFVQLEPLTPFLAIVPLFVKVPFTKILYHPGLRVIQLLIVRLL